MIAQNGELTIVQARVTPGDPHINTDGRDQLSLRYAIYDTLVRRDSAGRFVPALASSWHCEPDARAWTVTLRDDVTFSDGQPLTALDVVASIARVVAPDAPGEMATTGLLSAYFAGSSVEATGNHELRIVMARPIADLLDLLVDIAIIPADAARSNEVGPQTSGSGPYRLLEHGDGWARVEAVDHYWGGAATYHTVLWRSEPDTDRRVEMLLDGSADLATDIGPGGKRAVESAPGVSTVEADISMCVALLLNASSGVSADRRVRQALNYGADVERIITAVMDGAAQRVNGPLSILHFGQDPSLSPYPHDPVRARALLREAGFEDGLELTIDVPDRLPDEAQDLVAALSEDYARIGVTVTARLHDDRPAYAEMVKAKRIADACCFDSSPLSTYRVLLEKLHSGAAGSWWQGYANLAVDRILDEASATVDDGARQALYRKAYGLIRDDAPWVFLYAPRVIFGRSARLGDWQPALNGLIRLA